MMIKYIFLLFILLLSPVKASELTIILTSDGDGHTVAARVFGRYLAKSLSPDTKLTFKVVPGAGGLNSTNYLYSIAPKDGNTIGIIFRNIPLIGAIDKNSHFDASKFTWIGSLADGREDAGLLISNKIKDDVIFVGSENVSASNPIDFIEKYTNLKIKKVTGYTSSNSIRLAFLRNEVDGMATTLTAIKTYDIGWLRVYHPLIQYGNGTKRHNLLESVPTLMEMISDNKMKEALSIYENQFALLRPYIAPPGIPKNKSDDLRKAFKVAVTDKNFLEEASKIKLDVSPIFYEEAERIVLQTYSANPELLEMLK